MKNQRLASRRSGLLTNNYRLTIGWLYPDLMSTYGDRGNILALQKRCDLRNINVEILPITQDTNDHRLTTIDLLFGGGSQDREQEIVMRDLKVRKQDIIKKLIEEDVPALFVCGAPQLMGRFYEPSVGKRIEGLGIFNMETINPGPDTPRCIGNIIAEIDWDILSQANDQRLMTKDSLIVGFENHGGRTYLGKNTKPFAKVLKGFGNNGKDKTEGVVYKNAIGCYFHGPLLPKNPQIADLLIKKALEVKYKKEITLSPLDDTLELKARDTIVKRLGLTV